MSKKEQIIEEIRKIYDPELPVNIYELGLIYDVTVENDNFAKIKMTLTTPNCPVAGLVTGIAFVHYMYMRDVWIMTGDSPTVYRYIDWLITVPLLMLEFYFVLSAVNKADSGIFWRLMLGTLVMLVGGYLGEAGYINATLGFIIGMAGWVYILYEVFSGEAGKRAAKSGNKSLVTAFGAMRMIVTVGWAIYPLGYIFGYLTGGVDANSLNVIYNAADFLNKIAFGLIIWAAAMQQPGRAK
ncbi:bacteriorhodopsin [Candidatus Pelagibacter sp.]|nr:bacteriorhodopsin [Candidatus Pelagibacter sp.]